MGECGHLESLKWLQVCQGFISLLIYIYMHTGPVCLKGGLRFREKNLKAFQIL